MYSLRVILAFALVCSMVACTSKPKRSKSKNSGTTGSSATGRASSTPGAAGAGQVFLTALGRIVATDATRTAVRFSDSAALGGLGGDWTALAGYGATDAVLAQAQGAGIRSTQARYAVTAGTGPAVTGPVVTVLSGGQDPAAVKTALTAKGWTADGDRLVAPAAAGGAYPMVRAIGSDVLMGRDAALLATADQAKSLAADPVLRSLAECLGGVVVAQYADTPADTIAVGALRSGDGRTHAVVCSAWPSPSAAQGAAAAQKTAYWSYRSPIDGQTPIAAQFDEVTVTVTGSVVRVDSVVARPDVVLDAFTGQRLPYLRFQ
ncbi:hypothetical protein OHA72_51095 [Dactylosporangium sp. NBC_01737]|uniref:hypothetical protein n=1 Tax=Dactylosporangium sp. NBC_01737 TaxID=2975959 RepID=UPI002E1226E7|nr:hypothetical protein OHA72_51095 [Dactylosporangium sp. NBC_01737]